MDTEDKLQNVAEEMKWNTVVNTGATYVWINHKNTSKCSFHTGDTEFFTVLVFRTFAPTKTLQ